LHHLGDSYYHEVEPQPKLGLSPAKAQSVVISTEGRNLSKIPRPLGMTDLGPSLGVLARAIPLFHALGPPESSRAREDFQA
jgi:hypothetical protein